MQLVLLIIYKDFMNIRLLCALVFFASAPSFIISMHLQTPTLLKITKKIA